MKAIVVKDVGESLAVTELEVPAAGRDVLVQILAARVNPVDRAIVSGQFYAGHPPLPFVPGVEGVGRVVAGGELELGTLVWVIGRGIGINRPGTFAEYVSVPADAVAPLDFDGKATTVAALGIPGVTAWQALIDTGGLQADAKVLVLGATGAVGRAAVRIAVAAGASQVVAASRDGSNIDVLRASGATSTVSYDGHAETFAAAVSEAFRGGGPDLVIDPLCGAALEGAATAATNGAVIVQLGQSAGASANLSSAVIRGKQLQVRGYSVFATSAVSRARAMNGLLRMASRDDWPSAERIVDLEQAAEEWRQASAMVIEMNR